MLAVHQPGRQVGKTGRWAVDRGGELRLDQRSRVHQAFVWVQAGEESNVPVLVGLQGHHGLLQLVGVGTAWLLEVCWTKSSVSGKKKKPVR